MDVLTPRSIGLALFVLIGAALGLASAPLFEPDGLLGALGHFAFHGLCHQLPERSFAIGGAVMGICHRCSGLYAGVALGGLLGALGARVDPASRPIWIATGGLMLAQVALGWLFDALDLWPLRVLTGLVLGGWGGLALASAFCAPSSGSGTPARCRSRRPPSSCSTRTRCSRRTT